LATASGLPNNVPATTGGDGDGDLPVPVHKASAHARVYDDAGPACVLRYRHEPCCLLWDGKHRHPELVLRRSIPRLRTPLWTLRVCPRGQPAHHSGPVWLATPSPWRTSTVYLLPVSRRTRTIPLPDLPSTFAALDLGGSSKA